MITNKNYMEDPYFEEVYTDNYIHIQLNITMMCNYQCMYCCAHTSILKENHKFVFNDTTFDNILDLIKPYNGVIFSYFGGEPTLHPNIIKYIKKINNVFTVNSKQMITTNLSQDIDFFKQLKDIKNLKFDISYHGQEHDIFNFFEKVKYIDENFNADNSLILLISKDTHQINKNNNFVQQFQKYFKNHQFKNISIAPEIIVWPNSKLGYENKSDYKNEIDLLQPILNIHKNNSADDLRNFKYMICMPAVEILPNGNIKMCQKYTSLNVNEISALPNAIICTEKRCTGCGPSYPKINHKSYLKKYTMNNILKEKYYHDN